MSCEQTRQEDSPIGEEISSFSEFWICDGRMGEITPLWGVTGLRAHMYSVLHCNKSH
jgi:hypothetical protein